MSPLLLANGLRLQRGHHCVLSAIDCELAAGEVLMLIGPNGAGKSTLLSALAGDLTPAAGRLHFGGRELGSWSAAMLARHRAVLTQRTELTLEFSVEEVVGLGCLARGLSANQQRWVVDAALQALALMPLRRRSVPSLSGGEQARTHLARVMAQLWPLQAQDQQPRLLLLDEPCASLDPHHQHQVCGAIRRYARDSGAGVIVTMHDMNLAAQYADRVLALARGRCLAAGPPREVLTPDFVRACFGVGIAQLHHGDRCLLATHAA